MIKRPSIVHSRTQLYRAKFRAVMTRKGRFNPSNSTVIALEYPSASGKSTRRHVRGVPGNAEDRDFLGEISSICSGLTRSPNPVPQMLCSHV